MTDEFKPTGMGNLLLQGKDFYISYRGDTTNIIPNAPNLSAMFAGDSTNETALCYKDKNKFGGKVYLILNGDFRDEYFEAAKEGLEACLAVYNRNKEKHRSMWSDD